MDSTRLTREQADRVRRVVARHLRYLNRLCDRMNRLGFPPADPLFDAADRARRAVQDLHVAALYAKCQHGARKTAVPAGELRMRARRTPAPGDAMRA